MRSIRPQDDTARITNALVSTPTDMSPLIPGTILSIDMHVWTMTVRERYILSTIYSALVVFQRPASNTPPHGSNSGHDKGRCLLLGGTRHVPWTLLGRATRDSQRMEEGGGDVSTVGVSHRARTAPRPLVVFQYCRRGSHKVREHRHHLRTTAVQD